MSHADPSNGGIFHSPLDRPQPIIRACAMAYVAFERRDLSEMDRFLHDFGLIGVQHAGLIRYYRGKGEAPFLAKIEPSDSNRFIGFGVLVDSAHELEVLSAATGQPIEPTDTPGGGRRVRLTDPAGLHIDVTHGATPVERLPARDRVIPFNTPFAKRRVNEPVRAPVAPADVFKLGHVVLQHPDFAAVADWYMRHLGLLPSDVQVLPDGTPAMAFFRFDCGTQPADHHSVAILGGPAPALLHVSFETFDVESIGQGHQHLRAAGWTPFWGIGRHKLGSQIFDYWKDPVGDEWEHYADGDVFDASIPEGYHEFHRGTLWAWGDDLPDALRPEVDPAAIDAIHAAGGFGDMEVEKVRQLITALQAPPRPWMR